MKRIQLSLAALVLAIMAFQYAGDDSYNCHNYAWESHRRWLDDPTEYIEAATPCDLKDATHIVYFEDGKPIHSGLVLDGGWIQSKWGSNPVMVHPINVPGSGYGTDVQFFNASL